MNRQESEASLNWGIPSYYGVSRRASSRAESALGLPIGHDEDESQVAARPPSSAKAYTPPARDLITPPAQTFSLGIGESTSANKCRGMGRRCFLRRLCLPSGPELTSKKMANHLKPLLEVRHLVAITTKEGTGREESISALHQLIKTPSDSQSPGWKPTTIATMHLEYCIHVCRAPSNAHLSPKKVCSY